MVDQQTEGGLTLDVMWELLDKYENAASAHGFAICDSDATGAKTILSSNRRRAARAAVDAALADILARLARPADRPGDAAVPHTASIVGLYTIEALLRGEDVVTEGLTLLPASDIANTRYTVAVAPTPPAPVAATGLRIVFKPLDGPGTEFVEIEDADGQSVSLPSIKRPDGLFEIHVGLPAPATFPEDPECYLSKIEALVSEYLEKPGITSETQLVLEELFDDVEMIGNTIPDSTTLSGQTGGAAGVGGRPDYLSREEAEMRPFLDALGSRDASSTTSRPAPSTSTAAGPAATKNGSEPGRRYFGATCSQFRDYHDKLWSECTNDLKAYHARMEAMHDEAGLALTPKPTRAEFDATLSGQTGGAVPAGDLLRFVNEALLRIKEHVGRYAKSAYTNSLGAYEACLRVSEEVEAISARLAEQPGAVPAGDLEAEVRYWRRDAAVRLWNARTLLGTHERLGDEEKAFIRRDTLRTTLAAVDEIRAKEWGEPDEIADDLDGQVALARARLAEQPGGGPVAPGAVKRQCKAPEGVCVYLGQCNTNRYGCHDGPQLATDRAALDGSSSGGAKP